MHNQGNGNSIGLQQQSSSDDPWKPRGIFYGDEDEGIKQSNYDDYYHQQHAMQPQYDQWDVYQQHRGAGGKQYGNDYNRNYNSRGAAGGSQNNYKQSKKQMGGNNANVGA